MCQEVSRQGSIGAPYTGSINTGMEDCQRSVVILNNTDKSVKFTCSGIKYTVPAGKAATLPVGLGVLNFEALGRGLISYTVTSSVLPASLADAPAVNENYGLTSMNQTFLVANGGLVIDLSGGDYTKLVFSLPVVNQVVQT